jgi:septal ring factor EnvC (AmiA/AmiB activator)
VATGSTVLVGITGQISGLFVTLAILVIAVLAAIRMLHLDEVIGDMTGSTEIGKTPEDEEYEEVAAEFEASAVERGVAKSSKKPDLSAEEAKLKELDKDLEEVTANSTRLERAIKEIEASHDERLSHTDIEKKLKERGFNVEDF